MTRGKGWLVVLGILMGLWWPTVGEATDSAVTKSLPDSIDASKVFKTTGDINGSSRNNDAKFIAKSRGIQITDNAKNNLGSAWSLPSMQLDLSQNFVLPMWLYFGKNGEGKSGQGMAFVLHNTNGDENTGLNAFSTGTGQSLGVWGTDNNNTLSGSVLVANAAIPQSWALEFDEQVNNSRKSADNNGFDQQHGTQSQHIAAAYPGDTDSYHGMGSQSDPNKKFFELVHQGIMTTTLSDGKWHHVTLSWTAPVAESNVGHMRYQFDDEETQVNPLVQTVPIDLGKLALHTLDNHRLVYWGFTGTTGNLMANNVVAFEHIPGLVDSTVSNTITDETTHQEISDGGQTINNHELTYRYKIRYNGGRQNWNSIRAKLDLPVGINFTEGSIKYGSKEVAEKLSASEIKAPQLNHLLAYNLSSDTNEAIVTLTGTATDMSNSGSEVSEIPRQVASSKGTFVGENEVNTTKTPRFTVYPSRDWQIGDHNLDSDLTVEKGQEYTAKLELMMGGSGDYPIDKNIHLQVTLASGEVVMDKSLEDYRIPDSSASLILFPYYEVPIPTTNFDIGKNTVHYTIKDELGSPSEVITQTITVTQPQGTLTFSQVNEKSSFKTTALTGMTQFIPRQNDWNVGVADTLSNHTQWTVTAQAAPFFKKNKLGRPTKSQLLGSAVWVNAKDEVTPLTDAVQVASGTSSTDNLVDNWGQRGILLGVTGAALPGTYDGRITWTLKNAIA